MQRIEKLIFDQADRTPEAVAIEFNDARLSYRELKIQALEISRALSESGLVAGETVAIFQHRSLTTMPLMLGIWDAGGIVVPINPSTPVKMLECVVQDSSPRICVTDPALKPRVMQAVENVSLISAPKVVTGDPRSNCHSARSLALQPGVQPAINLDDFSDQTTYEDDCYVIYTSGSEGRPKGVRGSHKSLIHYLRWQAKEFSVSEADRFSQTAPLSFDFSLKEFLVPLLCGASVCIADRSTVIDARKFAEWVHHSRITLMCCVPTLLRSILQLPRSPSDANIFQSLRSVLISGDMLRWEDVTGWRERFGSSISLFNLYGPTESTVVKLFYRIPETRCPDSINVPVGQPIEDADVLIVGENDQPCVPGDIGEIVILSEWLARGYLNVERMSDHPFCSFQYQGKLRRAYRTGDLGRWLSDGNLELIGRRDRQVKIRGYRIELNEIESILSAHEGINDVAAVALNTSNSIDADDLAVIACYFTTGDPAVTEKTVRNLAKERLLPQVLSLTRFRRLDKLPLMANGKVDRLKLESLIDTDEVQTAQPSANALLTVSERILAMWEELLALEGINLEANFFELGGDSMTAIRLLRRMREELHPEVRLDDVYEFPSISQLSNRVEQLLA
jgi:amino acid adenylation domain-containing protein